MNLSIRLCLALCCVIIVACRPQAAKTTPSEPYLSDPNSVGFDIAPLPSVAGKTMAGDVRRPGQETAKFTFEISTSKPMEREDGVNLEMSSGTGALLPEPGSDGSAMLAALQKALEAKHLPRKVKRAERLPFEYVVLGDHNSQVEGGGFSAKTPGNWTAMKIFVGEGDDESEVFLNFNPVSRKAQFSEKDVDYGDAVLAKLATVL